MKVAWNGINLKGGAGSAITTFINSTLKISDSYFGFNNAYLSTVLLTTYDDKNPPEKSSLYVKNCIFNNNTSQRGGIIYLDEFGQGEILDSIFCNNSCILSSGTLILDTCPYSLVKNCTFINNSGKCGAAICIKIFEDNLTSNAQIIDSKFINNIASTKGGAISSVGGAVTIDNCNFKNNNGGEYGGGVFSRLGNLTVNNCEFKDNVAKKGGAVCLNCENSSITNSILNSYASNKGGSVYSTIDYTILNCTISKNKAINDKNIYGVYNNFKATVKIAVAKIKTSYKSGKKMKIILKYYKNKYSTMNVKLKIKVYTGKNYKTYYVTTNTNGIAYFKASRFSKGTHKIEITSANSYVQFTKAKTLIKISKSKGKISAPKVANKYKSKSYFKVTLKHKTTNQVLSGIKVKIKIYTGKKFKTYAKKTNSKGKIFISTKSLKKGKHKVTINSLNSNINFSKKSEITIK